MKIKKEQKIYGKKVCNNGKIIKQKEDNVMEIYIKETIHLKKDKNTLKEKEEKIRKNSISDINFIQIILVNFLIFIILFIKTKNNKFSFYYIQDSKISLTIKGIGEIDILGNGNGTEHTFNGINYLKEVYINGIKQDIITYGYHFNQTDNYVELIWNDSINSCKNMFFN